MPQSKKTKAVQKKQKQKQKQKPQPQPKNPENEKKAEEDYTELMNKIANDGDAMWKVAKDVFKNMPEFKEWDDSKKINYFRENLEYKDFMNDYPITTRYMICMGQYSSKAFRRYLNKCRLVKHPPESRREKGYMEDQWIRRQADYVRYLWEDYQRGHFDIKYAQVIWQDTYEKLKGEFDDFRNLHKEVEQNVKMEKRQHKSELLREMIERLTSRQQNLSDEDKAKLIEMCREAKKMRGMPMPDEKKEIDGKTVQVIRHADPILVDEHGQVLENPIDEIPENDNAEKRYSVVGDSWD